jgi:t-SNARE complex subunit (syntaxin)
MISDVKSQFEIIRNNLKTINKSMSEDDTNYIIKKIQYDSLTSVFGDTITKFYDTIEHNTQKHNKIITRQCKIIDPNITDEVINEVLENKLENLFSGAQLTSALRDLKEIQSRNEILLDLEKSLIELNSIFKDAFLIIESQSKTIESIENSVEIADHYVDRAVINTVKAYKYKKSIWKKKCMICICCCVILCVIAILILLFILHYI